MIFFIEYIYKATVFINYLLLNNSKQLNYSILLNYVI